MWASWAVVEPLELNCLHNRSWGPYMLIAMSKIHFHDSLLELGCHVWLLSWIVEFSQQRLNPHDTTLMLGELLCPSDKQLYSIAKSWLVSVETCAERRTTCFQWSIALRSFAHSFRLFVVSCRATWLVFVHLQPRGIMYCRSPCPALSVAISVCSSLHGMFFWNFRTFEYLEE